MLRRELRGTQIVIMNRTILFAEDDAHDQSLLSVALRRVGLDESLHTVHHGQEAIDFLGGSDPLDAGAISPALVMLSMSLRQGTALSVLQWIREQSRFDATIVVLLALERDDKSLERAYSLGANSFILKPRGVEGWNRIARAMREYWFGLNLAPASSRRSVQRVLQEH